VTGGSRGLGLEIAHGLGEAGAGVLICARRETWLEPAVRDLHSKGVRALGRVCDVTREADVAAAVDAADREFGAVDILVNNAGVSWGAEPEAMPLDKWRSVLEINLTGAFLFAQAAGRKMIARRRGAIINVASVAGVKSLVDGPHYAAYAASKAGLMGLTRELAASWGRHGIRVNAIAPGFFDTRLTEHVIPGVRARIEATTPLGRIGAPGEIKGVAVFLAGDAASYITGQTLMVDGGASVAG
jgi:gluconate 5-dehydrogenase